MLCLDDSVQQDMYRMSIGMMAGMCSKHDIKIAGNKVTTEAVCDLGMTKMQSQLGDDAHRQHRVPHRGRTRRSIRR